MTRVVTLLLTFALAGLIGCAKPPAEPDPKESGDAGRPKQGLRIALLAERSEVRAGEDPGWTAALVNDGPGPAPVVLPGDGSDYGWRTPVVRWSPEPHRPG